MTDPRFVPVSSPALASREEQYVLRALREGWISSRSPMLEEFEIALATRIGRRFAVALSSGSAALETAVAALGIRHGDEIILPAHTILSCAEAVIRAGATPVLIDSDPESWGVAAAAITSRVTSRTRAVIATHLYGLPCDIEAVLTAAGHAGIAVIEDAAQMIGANSRNRPCGSFGAISVASFFANKNLTTGEGGMLFTDDPALADRARAYRDLGLQPRRRFVHETAGWNYRMSGLQAALGLAQIERLDENLRRKRELGLLYREALSDCPALSLPPAELPQGTNTYWACAMLLNGTSDNVDRLLADLMDQGIEARPFFWPIHWQPVYRRQGRFAAEAYPVAERLSQQGFYLPSGPNLALDDAHSVCRALRAAIARLQIDAGNGESRRGG